jgi:hypothetical protein
MGKTKKPKIDKKMKKLKKAMKMASSLPFSISRMSHSGRCQ